MEKALADLIEISRKVGKDPMLVQGGGGQHLGQDSRRRLYVYQGQRYRIERYG